MPKCDFNNVVELITEEKSAQNMTFAFKKIL